MSKNRITVEELKAMDREMLPPSIVARVIGVDPYWITLAARNSPEQLKFPFLVVGTRTLVPRLGLIRFMEGLPPKEGDTANA